MDQVAANLFIFSGLPAVGKTSLARMLAADRRATHLRIDTIEQALRDLCDVNVEGEGYRLAYRIAADNLRLGLDVVADSCNPIGLTRREWEDVARTCGARFVNIEVICSDPRIHRQRVEQRTSDIDGFTLPSWDDVQRRTYEPWTAPHLVIDTAGCELEAAFDALRVQLADAIGKRLES